MRNEQNLQQIINRFSTIRTLVIGDAALDAYVKGGTERVSREAPVPVVNTQKCTNSPGCAGNSVVNVTSLGAQTYALFVLGQDQDGDVLLSCLKDKGVTVDHTIIDPTRTTLAKKRIFANNQMVVRLDTGSTESISARNEQQLIDSLDQLYPHVDVVLISDYGYGVITKNIRSHIKELQRQYKKVLVVDAKDLTLYKDLGVTLVKPNYEEAIRHLDIQPQAENRIEQIKRYERELKELTGAKIVAVTVDVEGSVVFNGRPEPYRTYSKPFNNSKAIGAGDTYIAAFAVALASHASIADCAEIAQRAAMVILKKEGTNPCTQLELSQASFQDGKVISDRQMLNKIVTTLRHQDKKIVFTNGCFDILHRGHVTYLAQAKQRGDILILGLNSDSSVRRLKGPERPINNEDDRAAVLAGLASIDYIIQFDENTPIELIKIVKPDVYIKGGDYTRDSLPETPYVEKFGGRVEIIPFVVDRSTTNIIKKIRQTSTPSHTAFQGMKHGKKIATKG